MTDTTSVENLSCDRATQNNEVMRFVVRGSRGLAGLKIFNDTVRPAQPQEASSISAIYRTIYGCMEGERIDGNYPFPQFMNSIWVRNRIRQGRICWLVSQANGPIRGAIGAMPNIGSERDQVAECFGLVVGHEWQRKGVGKELIASLVDLLRDRAAVMIGETRTGDPAAYRVIKSAGWLPFGFEPFAHRMPTGAEPMILMGFVSDDAIRKRQPPQRLNRSVISIAKAVLSQFDAPVPDTTCAIGYPVRPDSWAQLKEMIAVPQSDTQRTLYESLDDDESLRLRLDKDPENLFAAEYGEARSHASGVIALDHMRADDSTGGRVIEIHFTGVVGESPVAHAYLVWDLRDQRVRIDRLTTRIEGLQGLMLAQILAWLDRERRARKSPLCVVIDISADEPNLQVSLERLGCFPTAYYPSLIAGASARHDGIQYTKLFGWRFTDCFRWIRDADFAEGSGVLSAVAQGAAHQLS